MADPRVSPSVGLATAASITILYYDGRMSKRQKRQLYLSAFVAALAGWSVFYLEAVISLAKLSLDQQNLAPQFALYAEGFRVTTFIHDLFSTHVTWLIIVIGLGAAKSQMEFMRDDAMSPNPKKSQLDKVIEIGYCWAQNKGVINTTKSYAQLNIALTNTMFSAVMKISGKSKRYA